MDQIQKGKLEMWIELIEKKDLKERIAIPIKAPPKYNMELRAIVWSTRECVFKDEAEKCNDIYARGSPACQEP
jgi:hypothetical protein